MFYDILGRRKSVREFMPAPIEPDKLERIMETIRRSPSAANCQPWHFYIIKDDLRRQFDTVFFKQGFYDAPVVVAGCAIPDRSWKRKCDGKQYAWVDVTIALTELILSATAEGLGSCWVASFDMDKARELLKLPPSYELVSLVVLGYPKEPLEFEEKNRKPKEEIMTVL
jgi:nitroreductase